MTETVKPLDIDLNNDLYLDPTEIKKYGITEKDLKELGIEQKKGQEDLNTLKTKISLQQLEKKIDALKAIEKADFIPKEYKETILASNQEEKIGYYFLFKTGAKIIGKNGIEKLAKADIPLDETTLFLYELINIEEEKDKLTTTTIILTNEEIKELKKGMLKKAINGDLSKLQKFIEEQRNENISISEAIKGTSLAKKLEKNGENPIAWMKNIETLIDLSFSKAFKNLSEDTIHNISSGFFLGIIKFMNKNSKNGILDIKKLNQIVKSRDIFEILLTNDNKLVSTIKNLMSALSQYNKEHDKITSENNEILMNPEKFSDLFINIYNNNLDKGDIIAELNQAQKEKHAKYNKEEILTHIHSVLDTAGNLKDKNGKNIFSKKTIEATKPINELGEAVRGIKEGIAGFKEKGKNLIEQNKGFLFEIKSICEEIGIWKIVKEIMDGILKLFGYENGWDDLEDKVENKSQFYYVISYLKEKTSLKEIKKNQDSIFHKGFKNNLNDNSDKKIEQVSVKGNLSQRSLYYLSSLGNGKDDTYSKLDDFFNTKNFKNTLKKANIKEEDFFKNVFSTKKLNKDDKKITVGVINFTELSKIIEKAYKQEIDKIIEKKAGIVKTKYPSYKNGLTLNKLDKKYKEKIEKLVLEEEKEFKNLAKTLFGISDFSYTAYINGIGYVESRYNYSAKNGIGAMGKYQFMPYTIKDYKNIIGNYSQSKLNQVFLSNPLIQEKVMAAYTKKQLEQIAPKIKNKVSKGADIAFYLAKAHLGGAGAVLENRSDGNITQNKYAKIATNVYKNSKNSGNMAA